MVLLGKIMILQGVGHPISCLGVCYANDPKKGGYMTPAPALDLTTSLRGDFRTFGTMAPTPLSLKHPAGGRGERVARGCRIKGPGPAAARGHNVARDRRMAAPRHTQSSASTPIRLLLAVHFKKCPAHKLHDFIMASSMLWGSACKLPMQVFLYPQYSHAGQSTATSNNPHTSNAAVGQ